MKRRLITSGAVLRKTVAHITAPEAGRRVVITAFIGSDALEIIPNPQGIEIYCWDQPSATDPEGVADLMQGANVWFVSGLHMKIYWSQFHGVLLGSPNLSPNALGEDAVLLESALYYEDSSAVKIAQVEALLRSKHPRPAEDYIDDLRRRANRDPIARRGARRKTRNVAEYFCLDNPAPWRISFWCGEYEDYDEADYEALIGTDGIEDISEAKERLDGETPAPRGTAQGDWLLCVTWVPPRNPRGPLEWLNVSRVASVMGGRWAYKLRGRKQPPPFNCNEKGFAAALKRFLAKNNVAENDGDGITMTPRRIRLLAKELGL